MVGRIFCDISRRRIDIWDDVTSPGHLFYQTRVTSVQMLDRQIVLCRSTVWADINIVSLIV